MCIRRCVRIDDGDGEAGHTRRGDLLFDAGAQGLAVFGRMGCARRAGQGQHGGKHREPEGLHGDCHPHDLDRRSYAEASAAFSVALGRMMAENLTGSAR